MTDLRSFNRYQRRMNRFERDYIREARRSYNDARREARDILERLGPANPNLARSLGDALSQFERILRQTAREKNTTLHQIASEMAQSQFEALSRFADDVPPFDQVQRSTEADQQQLTDRYLQNATAWLSGLKSRLEATVRELQSKGEDEQAIANQVTSLQIAGGRASVFRHGLNTLTTESERNIWNSGNALAMLFYRAGESISQRGWEKQAVAGIDERTTDTCLRVHGQVQPLDKPFRLTGTPRFAGHIQAPPFHWRCRTSQALYAVQMEEIGFSTDQMRHAANLEIKARRETGKKVDIHPAHATSRRT